MPSDWPTRWPPWAAWNCRDRFGLVSKPRSEDVEADRPSHAGHDHHHQRPENEPRRGHPHAGLGARSRWILEVGGVAPHVDSELPFPPFPVADLHWHTAPAAVRLLTEHAGILTLRGRFTAGQQRSGVGSS